MAVEAEVTAAAVILAAAHTSVVAGISAVRISAAVAAACVSAARILAAPASAERISVALGSGGLGYRGLPRGPVSAVTARLRSAAM